MTGVQTCALPICFPVTILTTWKNIGELLKDARQLAGLKQNEIAEKLRRGLKSVSNYENGKTEIPGAILHKWTTILSEELQRLGIEDGVFPVLGGTERLLDCLVLDDEFISFILKDTRFPDLEQGSIIVIDKKKTILESGQIFGISTPNHKNIFLARIQILNDSSIKIFYDNQTYEPELFKENELTIHGKPRACVS